MGTQKQRLCPSTFNPATEAQKWILSRIIREELLDTSKELELIIYACTLNCPILYMYNVFAHVLDSMYVSFIDYRYTVPLVSLSSSPFLFFLIAQSQRNYSAAFEKIRSLFNSAPPVPVKLLILITTSSDYNFDGARINTSSNMNFQIKSYAMHGNNDNNNLHVILVHVLLNKKFLEYS